ncbi:MAG: glycosyltransferase family 4 protein [Pseudomonadota bacterium]
MDYPVSCKPRTILHVIDALNYGGAQRLLVLLAEWTPKETYKTIICALQANQEIKKQIESRGVRVVCFNRPRPRIIDPHLLLGYIYHNVKDIIRICRLEKVHVIHCHLSDAEFIGILAGFLFGAERIISTVHYPNLLPTRRSGDIRNGLRWLATKMIYRWADFIIAVSEDVARQLRKVFGINEQKVRIIVNGIDVESFSRTPVSGELRTALGLGPRDRILTTVARLMPPKGHTYLIAAIPQLIKRFASLKLLLVGDGELKEQLIRQTEDLGLSDAIRFLGNREDVPDILALTEIFVLPSLWEGTSLALLEAMAMAKPIVATNVPGNRAIIEHKKNGYLIPSEDPDSLAEAISYLLEHVDLAARYGKKAYELVRDRFDIRQTVSQLERLWN